MASNQDKYHSLEEGRKPSKPAVRSCWYGIVGAIVCCGIIAACIVIGVFAKKNNDSSHSHNSTPAPTYAPGTETIQVGREIKTLRSGNEIMLDIAPGCAKHDKYGCSKFAVAFGDDYTLNATIKTARAMTEGSTITGSLVVSSLIHIDLDCPLCGANCTIDLPPPIGSQEVEMPGCPIDALDLTGSQTVSVPSDNPLPFSSLSGSGSVTLKNADGSTEIAMSFDIALAAAIKE